MNPFLTNSMPITEMNALLFRDSEVQKIKDYVDARNQTVILGVEGVGKTSLLRTVFNKNYRIQKAKEKTLISRVTEFPSNLKDDDIYNHFIETILSAVDILSSCGERELMNEILSKCEYKRAHSRTTEKQFEEIVNEIYDFGFHIVIVVDNFERFTSSKEVTKQHHETLRKMLEKTQYIVSTNYDLNEDSLPQDVSGSLYLQAFAGHEIRIGGWSCEYTKRYVQDQMKDSEIKFSEATISNLYLATGGIPILVKLAGQYAFEYIESHQSEEDLKFAPVYNEKKVQLLLQHWSKMLTPMQITALRNVQQPSELDKSILRSLYLRGLLEYVQKKDVYGNVITRDDEYQFCCKYFGKYCNDEGKLEGAVLQNPLRIVETIDQARNELSVEELMEELKKRIEAGNADRDQLISVTKSLCKYLPNVTGTIDLNEDLSDDVLDKYLLNQEYLSKLDPKVRDFIYVGIQMDRCFENVTDPVFDFSTVYLSFCKAVEMHLNLTIVPMIKKASPNTTDQKGRKISSLPDDNSLMIGVIYTVLTKREVGLANRAIDAIKQRCRYKLNNKYPDNWWDSFEKMLSDVKGIRNCCPHTSLLKDDAGKRLLQIMFGYNQNPEKSFVMKCLNVHRDFMATYSTNN